MNKSLFEIEREYMALMAQIENQDGEIEPGQEVDLTINENEKKEKLAAYGWIIRKAEERSAFNKKMADQYDKAAKRDESLIKRLKSAALPVIQRNGKIKAGPFLFYTSKSERLKKPDDISLTPKKYIHTVRSKEINFKKIKIVLKEGRPVRGYSLEQRENLSIR